MSPSARRAPDLAPREQPLAQALGRLGRALPPGRLRSQVLAGVPLPDRAGDARRGPLLRPVLLRPVLLRPFAVAAAVLLALTGGLLVRSGAPAPASLPWTEARADAGAKAGAVAWTRTTPATVVDDPSVSLFHGLETFDRLAFDGLGGLPR